MSEDLGKLSFAAGSVFLVVGIVCCACHTMYMLYLMFF